MTDEGVQDTESWVKRHGAKYPYAYDPNGRLGDYFGVRSIPYAVLVDPNGIIAWTGHPARLDEGTLRRTLSGAVAQPITGWPKSTMKLQLLLKQGRYAQALGAAASLGKEYESFVRDRIRSRVGAVEAAHESGNYLAAMRLGEVVVGELTGLREAVAVKSLVNGMRRDREVQRILQGQEELSRLAKEINAVRDAQEAARVIGRLRDMSADYPGTIVAAQAEAWLRDLKGRRK